LLADQARVSDSTDEARLLSEQAKAKLEAGREAIDGTIGGFKGLTELVVQLGERMAGFASAMNQVQTVSRRSRRSPARPTCWRSMRRSRRRGPAMPAAASRWSRRK